MSSVVRRSIAHRYQTRSSIAAGGASPLPIASATSTTDVVDLIPEAVDLTAAAPNEGAKNDLYQQLQELEEQDGVIRNIEFIFCLMCDSFIDVYDGILVRECLHQLCIDCVRKFIIASAHIEIQCPAVDCECFLEDREIRSLLTQAEYERHINKYILAEPEINEKLYKELLDLEQQGLIYNTDPFECEICMTDIENHDGVIIRECLHQFCIDCVRHTIIHSEEAEIKCPANACDCTIQDREIRSLLTQAEFDKYNVKGLRIAESQAPNSYHCKKANCEGWCIVDDEVNTFVCPRCVSENCLVCRAIHTGQNCKEYQEELRYAGMTDNQRSELCLDEIVQKNLGMRCTKCKIVIMKREGCDYLICSMCKTELCWAMKMSRWGPKGRGDTSGGCGCSFPTKKCHPNCRNCH
ncbi:ranBP-type and C3HC4-type zinc finger-containing protein 1-like [Sitodiplosis mosellana]|uniref:ranBP-type and C3HC4-type zinc finger-containing protein 1-like n=1 Tax=Sitodiplosis mosellana TaxID=263140 RepID=UPI002443F5E5|nr:ranBP-type and C3HC4-type zinc finger-containing protein 1-like [Sitodiplosis mosellana]